MRHHRPPHFGGVGNSQHWLLAAGRLAAVISASALVLAACTPDPATVKPSQPNKNSGASSLAAGPPSRPTPGDPHGSGSQPVHRQSQPPDPYPHGRLFPVSIPGGTARFAGRPAYVYLPPAALHGSGHRLPVLELLHGVPGDPSNWQVGGDVRGTMDAFAAHHGGLAPIVVMPDVNGGTYTDTECVRTPNGADVEQYLTVQVPQYLTVHYPASRDRRRWAIAGLSEGGLCALMLALRAYPDYAAIGDFSGLGTPAVGDSTNPQRTIDALFGGSRVAYDEHDPRWLLQHHVYPRTALWLFTGTADHRVVSEQARIASQARRAGLPVKIVTMPGGHSWKLWRPALKKFLPWMWPIVTGGG